MSMLTLSIAAILRSNNNNLRLQNMQLYGFTGGGEDTTTYGKEYDYGYIGESLNDKSYNILDDVEDDYHEDDSYGFKG